MRAKTGDTICYIQKYKDEGEEWKFRLVTSSITAIRIGKTATKVYSKRFRTIDVEELESNTEFFAPGVILVQEPFLDVGDLREIAEKWIESEAEEYHRMFLDMLRVRQEEEKNGTLKTTYETPESCPHCMGHLSKDWSFCPECGRPIDKTGCGR